ncbi:MAG: radical SAM protein, partial [Myxococcales bacterium]|nr:radical SAM protein [Myxococcales bacterium]
MRSEELVARAAARLSRGAGAARRVYRQVMLEGRFAPEELGLAAETSAGWRAAFDFELPELVRLVEEPSETGKTAKAVLRLADGLEAECVLIPMGRGRQTLCVSSQVGCKMGCSFCETARMGLMRQLAPHEIVAQLLVARHVLGWSVRNVVFMGMGEALDDFDSLHQVLRILLDSAGLSIAQERLTVCTVGRVDGIERLAQTGLKRLNLSISLNSADPRRREELMPVSRRFPLEALQAALVAYRPRRNFALGVNYCLMPGLNDRREDARLVAAFCAPIGRVLLNLIPYNPGGRPLCRAPTEEEGERFVA